MKEKLQRIAIAEACGWSNIHQAENGTELIGWWSGEPRLTLTVPSYLSDLNAMHEAEKTKLTTKTLLAKFAYELDALVSLQDKRGCIMYDVGGERVDFAHVARIASATAEQRAEAFLRTLNLWKD